MSLETNHEYINQTLGQEKTIKNPNWRNKRKSGKSVASDVVHQIGINTKTVRLELESLQIVKNRIPRKEMTVKTVKRPKNNTHLSKTRSKKCRRRQLVSKKKLT